MSGRIIIEPLGRRHDRAAFDSREPRADRFIHRTARKYIVENLAVVRVAVVGFADAQAGGVAGGQNRPVLDVLDTTEKMHDLLGAENSRQILRSLRTGDDLLEIPPPHEGDAIQKTERGDGHLDRTGRQLLPVCQIQLVCADFHGAEIRRGSIEVAGEQRNLQEVCGLRDRRQVPHLHILGHALPKGCRHRRAPLSNGPCCKQLLHVGPPETPHICSNARSASVPRRRRSPGSIRAAPIPRSGLVQHGIMRQGGEICSGWKFGRIDLIIRL